ncbi:MAG: squalene/phytoene synthase family protein [Ignavibacteria bacterium]
MNIDNAYRECQRMAKVHYENFPVASILLPAHLRKHIFAVYCFARYADDIADSKDLPSDKKLSLLKLYRYYYQLSLNNDFDAVPEDIRFILIAFCNTVREFSILEEEPLSLLTAFELDAIKNRYERFEELLEYSKFSANPIGNIYLHITGYSRHSEFFKIKYYSDRICTGLQLINFLQDVRRDMEMDRVYLPLEIMRKYNYSYNDLFAFRQDERFIGVMRELWEATNKIYSEGYNILKYLNGKYKKEMQLILQGGNIILSKLKRENFMVLTNNLKLNKLDKVVLLIKTITVGVDY